MRKSKRYDVNKLEKEGEKLVKVKVKGKCILTEEQAQILNGQSPNTLLSYTVAKTQPKPKEDKPAK